MDHYIGIDLGTTNSVICAYDGRNTQILKSPEQSDVTPSAICVDKRGRRYYGRRAYEMAPMNEKNSATLFKRYMGTGKIFTFEATGDELTPEACSAEILRVLYGYLPEEVRTGEETATVITVPAAFNQMKKDATLEAARLAGLGRVALMQEPVAAVMSVMKQDDREKVFLIYDLGGGTFDITVAESVAGRVSLLVQGGKEMCGGRDWDRMIFRKVVEPWLRGHFRLPDDPTDPTVRKVTRLAMLAVEQAKIELSAAETSAVRMDEARLGALDLDGEEIYLDVPLTRDILNGLIAGMINDTIEVTRETMKKAGLTPDAVEQIVFVGGPTCYKPLRDQVTQALGVSAGVEVNPMTAVAEGAAIYAESIDWSSERHERKAARDEMNALEALKISYEKRTSADKGRVAFVAGAGAEGLSAEITCEDTGWVSGRTKIGRRVIIEVPLMYKGENFFRVDVYGADGMPVTIPESRLAIVRTLATVSAIPASHPIAVKALDRIGGVPVPVYLVEENDLLPKRGTVTFRAGESLVAGSNGALVFSLWEGAIREPIEDNRYIGTFRIPGTSFYSGVIPAGAEIICEYEMNESGTLHLGVSVPCAGISLTGQNFYSRADGQTDVQDPSRVLAEAEEILRRTVEMRMRVSDPELDRVRTAAVEARYAAQSADPEAIAAAANDLLDCRRRLARLRQSNRKAIRSIDLEKRIAEFESERSHAQAYEIAAFENLIAEARMAIERDSPDFDAHMEQMRGHISNILWRQDNIIRFNFTQQISHPERFADRAAFDRLRADGIAHMENGNIDALRGVLSKLFALQEKRTGSSGEDMYDDVNIVRS
ncbi:MAG: Hsp70 family protein [Clostridia bacterium]|nr:Hsp70 family protein [Clostridia bacterium]